MVLLVAALVSFVGYFATAFLIRSEAYAKQEAGQGWREFGFYEEQTGRNLWVDEDGLDPDGFSAFAASVALS